jgi:glutamate carboxypeptidase
LVHNIIFTLTPDEETGSQIHLNTLKQYYKQAMYALVLEGMGDRGELCNSRRGIGLATLSTFGKAGHSGKFANVYPNAIEEAAHQIAQVGKLARPHQGLTINIGKISGGDAVNVVASKCRVEIDIRYTKMSQYFKTLASIQRITHKKLVKGSRVNIASRLIFPAMETNQKTKKLQEIVSSVAPGTVFQHRTSASDGNLISSLGIGTLDGFGTQGRDIHTPKERMLKKSLTTSGELLYKVIRQFMIWSGNDSQ